jgi:hypothetical protein
MSTIRFIAAPLERGLQPPSGETFSNRLARRPVEPLLQNQGFCPPKYRASTASGQHKSPPRIAGDYCAIMVFHRSAIKKTSTRGR